MNLEQFQATRMYGNINLIRDGSAPDVTGVFEYDGGCYIEIVGSCRFRLTIDGAYWESNNLDSLEKILFENWYVDMCNG